MAQAMTEGLSATKGVNPPVCPDGQPAPSRREPSSQPSGLYLL